MLRLGRGGGRAEGAVRLSSDGELATGLAAAGAHADSAGAPFAVLGALAIVAMTVSLSGPWSRFAALHVSHRSPSFE